MTADRIEANGITIAGNAKLEAISINIPGGGVPLGKSWNILKATGAGNTIAGDFLAANKILPFGDGSGKSYTTSKNAGATSYYLNS